MSEPHFMNADLEIESDSSLNLLEREFGERVVVLYSGRIKRRHCLFLELARFTRSWKPAKVIHGLCALVEELSPAGRKAWDKARRKALDLGYEARFKSTRCNQFALQPDTVLRVAGLGASLAVTFYREDWFASTPRPDGYGSTNRL